jgi:hypothetical protein
VSAIDWAGKLAQSSDEIACRTKHSCPEGEIYFHRGTGYCSALHEREAIMIRLFGILVLVPAVAGCVTAQQPYDAYGGPGYYVPSTSIGIGVGGGSFGGGGIGGGVGVGVGF